MRDIDIQDVGIVTRSTLRKFAPARAQMRLLKILVGNAGIFELRSAECDALVAAVDAGYDSSSDVLF